jgi:hypothetical protein
VRHLANVFQGLLMSTPEQFNNVVKLGKLWLHESERVYADRLVSLADLETYSKSAVNIAKKYFNIRWENKRGEEEVERGAFKSGGGLNPKPLTLGSGKGLFCLPS